MGALGLNPLLGNIGRFTNSDKTFYLRVAKSTGAFATTGDDAEGSSDGSKWLCLGLCKGSKQEPGSIDEFKQIGDGGKVTYKSVTIQSYKFTTTIMNRDAPTRNIVKNADGKFFHILAVGHDTLVSTTDGSTVAKEYSLMFGVINPKGSYDLATGELAGVEIESLANSAAFTGGLATAGSLPVANSAISTTALIALSVGINEMMVSVDATN
jgi:hypothetical protein